MLVLISVMETAVGAKEAAAAAAAACTSRGDLHRGREGGESGKLRVAEGPRKQTTAAS